MPCLHAVANLCLCESFGFLVQPLESKALCGLWARVDLDDPLDPAPAGIEDQNQASFRQLCGLEKAREATPETFAPGGVSL